jgi:hypothetical protein
MSNVKIQMTGVVGTPFEIGISLGFGNWRLGFRREAASALAVQ